LRYLQEELEKGKDRFFGKLSDYSEKEILQFMVSEKNTLMKLKDYMKEHQMCFREYKSKKA
jgi:hypothetical protein